MIGIENVPPDPVMVLVVISVAIPPKPGRLFTLDEFGAVSVTSVAVVALEPRTFTTTVCGLPLWLTIFKIVAVEDFVADQYRGPNPPPVAVTGRVSVPW